VFGDLEDPSTRSALRVLERAALVRPGELRLAFRHRPLPSHARARETAELATAVYARRGAAAFWRFVSELSRTTERISDASLARALAAGGATRAELAAEVLRAEARVQEDLELATLFSVRGPQLFVNGRRVAASESRAALERTLAEERRRAVALIADGARPSAVYRLRVERELAGLGAAPSVRSCPTLGDSPRQGPADALLTVVEFSDFECPYSKRAAAYLEKSAHRSELALVWKAFPLNQHARAKVLASYALSALSRGGAERFWALRSALFGEPGTVDDAALERISAPLGLNAAALIKDQKGGAHTERIARDVREGERFGVEGTPTFFVNGRRLDGVANASTLEHELGSEIGRARRVLTLGVPRARVHDLLCSREW
jgi:protein-disulfide isomerase